MRSTRNTPSIPTWLLAALLTLPATAASAAPARLLPSPRPSPTAWGWGKEAFRVLAGITTKGPSTPADDPNRGPLIDPDGGALSQAARPRTS